MRIVVAPDSFKECLSAQQVASAIARGWRNAAPEDAIVEIPLADGGEGTTMALTEALGGQLHTVAVTGRWVSISRPALAWPITTKPP